MSVSTALESNNTIHYDTNDVWRIEDLNLWWFSDKYSNIGRISGHREYYDLLDLKLNEDSWSIVLTLNTLQEINEKLKILMKNDIWKIPFMSQTSFESVWNEGALLDKKLTILKSITVHMEQTSKILLLFYLLQTSIAQRDVEDFNIIIEHLYYLSLFRRYSDTFKYDIIIEHLYYLSLFRRYSDTFIFVLMNYQCLHKKSEKIVKTIDMKLKIFLY